MHWYCGFSCVTPVLVADVVTVELMLDVKVEVAVLIVQLLICPSPYDVTTRFNRPTMFPLQSPVCLISPNKLHSIVLATRSNPHTSTTWLSPAFTRLHRPVVTCRRPLLEHDSSPGWPHKTRTLLSCAACRGHDASTRSPTFSSVGVAAMHLNPPYTAEVAVVDSVDVTLDVPVVVADCVAVVEPVVVNDTVAEVVRVEVRELVAVWVPLLVPLLVADAVWDNDRVDVAVLVAVEVCVEEGDVNSHPRKTPKAYSSTALLSVAAVF